MKCEFQIEIMKCGMVYVSTKWLVQSSSSSLESFSVRPMSWAMLHSTQPQVSARHNILSARTPSSYTVTFEAVATDELQECLWCRMLVHPVNGYVTVNHIPAMTMWTWRMSCRFQGIVPNAGLVICSCDMVPESIFGWRQIAGVCILAAEQFVPNSVCILALFPYSEHTHRAHPWCRSSSWPHELPNIIMAAHMFGSDSTVMERLPFAFSHECTCAVTSG